MKYKVLLFDLDGTLAPVGGPIPGEIVENLRSLEEQGCRVALISGKPAYYLCGLLRQLGLQSPIIAGENGTVIQVGVDLPPSTFLIPDYPHSTKENIKSLKELIDAACPGMWYQPNIVGLTPFPRNDKEFSTIQAIIDENPQLVDGVDVYRHCDSFDIMPTGLDKKQGALAIARLLEIDAHEMIAVGDGVNDYPMFEAVGCSVGINLPADERIDIHVAGIEEAISVIQGLVTGEKL